MLRRSTQLFCCSGQNHAWRYPLWLSALAIVFVLGRASLADELGSRRLAFAQSTSQPAAEQKNSDVSAEAERKALAFIKEHQPRLVSLLSFLKAKQPAAYQKALREMGRSQQRLESLAKRDQELYAIELQLWKIRSRLRLLAAELSVSKGKQQEDLGSELIELVKQEAASDMERLQLLRARAARQLAKLDEELQKRTENREELVAKSLKSWQNRIKKNNAGKSGK